MCRTPFIDREYLLSIGCKHCVKCGHIYPATNEDGAHTKIYDWCPTCEHKYQIKNGKIRIESNEVAVTLSRQHTILEESGFRKCTKCNFTLPKSEFSSRKPICRSCSDRDRGKKLIDDHLDVFNLAECTACSVIKPKVDFYINEVGKRRKVCVECEKKSANLRNNRTNTVTHSGKTKKCVDCGALKDTVEYGINRAYKDGLQKKCRDCLRNYTRKYNAANKQKRSEYHKTWVMQNKKSVAISKKNSERKRRSRKRNVPYAAITAEQTKYLEELRNRIFGEGV